jgi:hypothetical protein
MASDVDICNMALSHLGADATVASISPPDGSAEAGHCARFYPIARRILIDAHSWTWAKTRATLAEVTNPSTVWTYAYALPSNCIRPLRVLQLSALSALVTTEPTILSLLDERGSTQFDIESGVLLTHEPEAVLLYRRDVTDSSRFPPLATSALSLLLASYLAGPIIKGLEGANIGGKLRDQAMALLAKAAAADANSTVESNEFTPASLGARE